MSSVAVIDYGMGNLHSIKKALQHASSSVDVQIVSDVIIKHDVSAMMSLRGQMNYQIIIPLLITLADKGP